VASLDNLKLDSLIGRGREARWLEYKQSATWGDLRLKIAKAAIAFANTRDGGYIVIGMRDLGNDRYEPQGMTAEHLATYDLDTVQAGVNSYAEPFVSLDCAPFDHNGKTFFVIAVSEFEDAPVICTRGADRELRRAAIYTRSRRVTSSAPIENQTDMRALLDLATDRALGREVERLRSVGRLPPGPDPPSTDEERFARQREEQDMVTVQTGADILSEIRLGPHWEVVIHPAKFEPERIPSLGECREAVERAQVKLLSGRGYPRIEDGEERGQDWVGGWISSEYTLREHWKLYQTGQFVHFFTFLDDTEERTAMLERYRKAPMFKPQGFSPSGLLNVDGALYTCTEIFQFAARLMADGVLDEAPTIRIGMHQIRDRMLAVSGNRMWPPNPHFATENSLEHTWRLQGPGVEAEAARLAQEATLWFFERFGCDDFPRESLRREQEEFLAGRA